MKQEAVRNKSNAAVVPAIRSNKLPKTRTSGKSKSSSVPLQPGTELMFRAEGDIDANLFMYALPEFVQEPWRTIHEFGEPEITFTLRKQISLDDLRWIASAITDAHTIVQTLMVSEKYTGVRQMDLSIDVADKDLMPSAEVLSLVVRYARNFADFSLSQAFFARNTSQKFDALYKAVGYPAALLKR